MSLIQIDEGALIEGNRLTALEEKSLTVYNLPRGARRIAVLYLSETRSQLVIGGFKSTTVVINGPTAMIEKLREAVLA
jgi:hypothetical protein